MEEGVALQLICLVCNLRKEVSEVLHSFFSFFKKIDERKTHSMLVLMLDPRFKSLHLIFSFISYNQGITIIEQYDTI
jgi:hypothetical protein